jgi:hypothetical protein
MASLRQGDFGRCISVEEMQNETSNFNQFQFKVDEANEIDIQTTTDVEVTPVNDDLQQQDLTPDQLEQLFNRASFQLVEQSTDEQEFFKRETSIKPPKTSQIIETPFPPAVSDRQQDFDIDIEQLQKKAKQDAGPLIIERYSPSENQIDHPLTTVTLTYNQPMIAISSLDEQIDIKNMGISLTPNIEGRWRWTGTQTVQFQAKHRLSYATKYTLTVDKAHCVSALGGKSI